jgi:hypothetical protein
MYEVMAYSGREKTNRRVGYPRPEQREPPSCLKAESSHRDGLRLDLRRVDLELERLRAAYTVQGVDAFDLVDRATAQIAAALGRPSEPLRFGTYHAVRRRLPLL